MSEDMKIAPRGPMFSMQDSLPLLPVPPLKQTLDKYLHTVRPLVSDQQFAKTKEVVQQFLQSSGPQLQKVLEKRAEEKTNWLSEWWKNVAYLENRVSTVVNVNPAVAFPLQDYRGKEEQLRFAAKFVAAVLDFKLKVDEQTLAVETLGGKPLCMMQYYQIFSACRVPGPKKDTHVIFPSTSHGPPRHITVMHNNHIFSVEVYGSKGRPLTIDQLYNQLKEVTNLSQSRAPPVGLLTSLDRDTWAEVYADLMNDPKNRAAMRDIQGSIFTLSLDQPVAGGNAPPSPSSVAAEFLHGGGPHLNSANRWFDKTVQFMIGADGACGLIYEHTTAEGPPIAAIMDHILHFVKEHAEGQDQPITAIVPSPRRVHISLTTKAMAAIQRAELEMKRTVENLQMTVFTFDQFGKDFIKRCHLSPDAFIQMALQLTYYRLYKRPCATYETASLRRFQLGRTDTIRSCSEDSSTFCQAMDDTSVPDASKVALLRQAVKAHRKYTDEAINGQGVDRHLLGLKLTAMETGTEIPDLYRDAAFTESSHFRVSTSQVGAKHDTVMCFGPVVPDGYGCCYNPQNSRLNFAVTAFNACPHTDSDRFSNVLRGSLMDMKELLLKVPSSESKL
ncbi:carnitine O-acetyltransferase-like [Babylonia areolata]|uniref:carnitine O-acetyltransferase-like n=1 Tax=Babylonia areolata TaxID=304850 RepID=UPI003FD0F2AD